jgi:hypothetical protein
MRRTRKCLEDHRQLRAICKINRWAACRNVGCLDSAWVASFDCARHDVMCAHGDVGGPLRGQPQCRCTYRSSCSRPHMRGPRPPEPSLECWSPHHLGPNCRRCLRWRRAHTYARAAPARASLTILLVASTATDPKHSRAWAPRYPRWPQSTWRRPRTGPRCWRRWRVCRQTCKRRLTGERHKNAQVFAA